MMLPTLAPLASFRQGEHRYAHRAKKGRLAIRHHLARNAGGSSSRTCSELGQAPGGGVGAARAQHRQCVGPCEKVSGRGGSRGTLQAKASRTSWQQRETACCSDPGISVVFFTQQREQAPPDLFHRHRRVLVDKHVSIKLRMKFFDAVVTPTILFGLHTLALTGVQLSIQKRMLRSMVRWIRIQDESWHDTMSRMKSRVAKVLHQHPIEAWTRRLARCHHSFAVRVAQTNGWVTRVVTWNPESNWQDNLSLAPKRRQGRPLTRWDDKLWWRSAGNECQKAQSAAQRSAVAERSRSP